MTINLRKVCSAYSFYFSIPFSEDVGNARLETILRHFRKGNFRRFLYSYKSICRSVWCVNLWIYNASFFRLINNVMSMNIYSGLILRGRNF